MAVRQPRRRFLASPWPSLAIEIARDRISAVSLAESGGQPVVASYVVEPLKSGLVDPALNAVNVHEPAALTDALKSVVARLETRVRRAAVILPDTVGKVSLIRFDKVPARSHDLDQLIRWQVRKAAPFKIEEAQVSWLPGAPVQGGGREFVVTMARRDVIERYEAICSDAGLHAGIIDLATFNLVNAALSAAPPASADWLLVNVGGDAVTLAVVRGEHLIFFRNRPVAEGDLADLVHQTAMYHEDRLGGGGFSRVVLAGASLYGSDHAERARRSVEERLGATVEPIDFRSAAALRDRISANAALIDALAPAVGVLLRERAADRPSRAGAGAVA